MLNKRINLFMKLFVFTVVLGMSFAGYSQDMQDRWTASWIAVPDAPAEFSSIELPSVAGEFTSFSGTTKSIAHPVRKIRLIPNNNITLKYFFIFLSSFLLLKNEYIFTENLPKNQIIL